jgi:hypothetical protein
MFFDQYHKFLDAFDKHRDKQVLVREFTSIVRRYLKDPTLKMVTVRDETIPFGTVVVGGTFDAEDYDAGEHSINIMLFYHTDQEHIRITQPLWDQMSYDVTEIYFHELIHLHQHQQRKRSRRFKCRYFKSDSRDAVKREQQEYLGSSDEIDAYAFSITAARAVYGIPFKQHPIYQAYHRVFKQHPQIIRQLKAEIHKYITRLEQQNGQ